MATHFRICVAFVLALGCRSAHIAFETAVLTWAEACRNSQLRPAGDTEQQHIHPKYVQMAEDVRPFKCDIHAHVRAVYSGQTVTDKLKCVFDHLFRGQDIQDLH